MTTASPTGRYGSAKNATRCVNSNPTLIPESTRRRVPKVSKLPKWAIKQAGGIGKKAWRLARRGRKSSSPRRRAVQSRRRTSNPTRRKMPRKMVTPHPSITGMAAGFSLVDDLNKGDVVGKVFAGNASAALKNLSKNAQDLIKTDSGRKSLVQAVGIAAIGAWARKALPATKIGGSKLYFKI